MLPEYLLLMKGEIAIVVILLMLLIIKLAVREDVNNPSESNLQLMPFINLMLALNVGIAMVGNTSGNLFGDMFMVKPITGFSKILLSAGALVVSLTATDWLRNHRRVLEFYMLLLSTLLGMYLMISAGNLMMLFVGLELASIPMAALVNFDLDKKRSSEAAMKMILLSAFASGILLFGISLLYGTTGTMSVEALSLRLDGSPLQILALVFVMAGFGFKISAVPFHLWTADVYEGAPAPVTAYLSVVSKSAALITLVTVLSHAFRPLSDMWYQIIMILSVVTMVVGNLFAMRQANLKRLLAFSSISQVGFILVGMSGPEPASTSSVYYFLTVYLFSNLGAFSVIAMISARTGQETFEDYKGLYQTNPLLTWVLALSLFSLAGIPPMAGFFGKFFLLMAGAANSNYSLLIIAALNMVIALYYYLLVVKNIFTGRKEHPIIAMNPGPWVMTGMVICLAGILAAGVYGPVYQYIYNLVSAY